MRAVLQRVRRACVRVDDRIVGQIGPGLLVLLGIAADDGAREVDWMLDKALGMRVFENDDGKFDRSLVDAGGALLVVSQFTLLADTRKGRRPSFTRAARPEVALPLYERFIAGATARGIEVAGGSFGANMDVDLVNHGPVTIVVDSDAS